MTGTDMELKFTVLGHKQLSRNLRILAKDIHSLREFFQAAVQIVEERSNELWATEGSVVEKANPWPPLAASTIKARQNRWGYYKRTPSRPTTLRWTGSMQDTRARSFSDKYGRLQFTDPKAMYHMKGGRVPRRVIIDLSNPTNALIVKALQEKVQRDIGIFGRQA